MLILAAAYSGSLVSFFSVDVFPPVPKTVDDIAALVQEKDLKVRVCCRHINESMKDSTLDAFKILNDRVSGKKCVECIMPMHDLALEQVIASVQGDIMGALSATNEGKEIYVYPRNGLEIQRRVHMDV